MSTITRTPTKARAVIDSTAYMDQGACAPGSGVHPDMMVPFPGDKRGTAQAIQVCAGCPVRELCLEAALTSPAKTYGVLGGMGEKEREKARKARKAGSGVL